MTLPKWLHPAIPIGIIFGASTLFLATVYADPFDGTLSMEPMVRDTVQYDFQGRTIASATINCWAIAGTTDATPNGMIAGGPTAVGGSFVNVTLSPTTIRTGKIYQCRLQATDSSGNTPTANIRVEVRKVSLG